ncbi:MAG: glycosyltransferase [Nakamurella multipartita]
MRPRRPPARPAVAAGRGGRDRPAQGQDLLVDALATLPDLDWSCTVVGALDVAPDFAARVRAAAGSPRIRFRGPLTGPDLAAAYAHADLLVLPSRAETYGMVIGDALARAIPVLATRVGGVPEALGAGDGSGRPGMLVAADDPAALAAALRDWLGDPARRQEWRRGGGRASEHADRLAGHRRAGVPDAAGGGSMTMRPRPRPRCRSPTVAVPIGRAGGLACSCSAGPWWWSSSCGSWARAHSWPAWPR